ncbi:hypothetical protein AAG570_011168 [Ranatra chinensis]|uniref:Uncharacterized protein n=1 Tax=Ranatra chinensis TaxID=642074 RepID=A0ABD0YJT7_9HEMI
MRWSPRGQLVTDPTPLVAPDIAAQLTTRFRSGGRQRIRLTQCHSSAPPVSIYKPRNRDVTAEFKRWYSHFAGRVPPSSRKRYIHCGLSPLALSSLVRTAVIFSGTVWAVVNTPKRRLTVKPPGHDLGNTIVVLHPADGHIRWLKLSPPRRVPPPRCPFSLELLFARAFLDSLETGDETLVFSGTKMELSRLIFSPQREQKGGPMRWRQASTGRGFQSWFHGVLNGLTSPEITWFKYSFQVISDLNTADNDKYPIPVQMHEIGGEDDGPNINF